MFAPQKMPENEKVKIHWDMKIHTDIKIMDYSRPDIVVQKESGYCNTILCDTLLIAVLLRKRKERCTNIMI